VNECIVEQSEALIVAVVQQSLEFAVSYLEKSEFNGDDLSIQVCEASLAIHLVICLCVLFPNKIYSVFRLRCIY
jgi:predicted membrane protein